MKAYLRNFTSAAQAAGITRLKYYIEERLGRNVAVYEGALEQLERSEERQLFIEGEMDGLSGGVFVENFDESLMAEHIRCIIDSAHACNAPFVPYDLEGLGQTPFVDYQFTDLHDTVEKMCQAEKAAYAVDSRILPGIQIHMEEACRRFTLADETDRFATDVTLEGDVGVRLAAREGDQVQPGGMGMAFRAENMPDLSQIAREAAGRAVSRLGAGSYATGVFPVVLDSRVVGELLHAFMPAFFASNVHSRMSVLAGRLGEQAAGENISILEDPMLPGGYCTRRFDDEGVPTQKKAIIRQGVLECFLHNRQSARQAGCASGGNGFKASFKETVSTGYTNVYIPNGEKTRAQLLEEMGSGLYICGVNGVFAGARPNSGDFSIISSGYRVENGQIGRAVSQITIAGNFFEMLKTVAAVGCDENWMCTAVGSVRTPSLYIRSLSISGKEK